MEDQDRIWMQVNVGTRAEEADDFLYLLANDDAFRERLSSTPGKVLEEFRIEVPEGSLPDTIELPSKEDASEFLDRSRQTYGGHGPGPTPPVLGFVILAFVLGSVPLPPPPPPSDAT